MTASHDPFNLDRFVQAQEQDYQRALQEIRSGQKRSHWMWYIFPQLTPGIWIDLYLAASVALDVVHLPATDRPRR
jgi:uncharacterized protein (DUF1810 family)